LQRQVLFTEDDIGTLKVTAAEARLKKLNSDIQIEAHTTAITSQHAQKIIPEYDLIIDGTDNFTAHYLINDACVLGHKPLVYGSVERFAGEVGLIIPHESPCYRCLYPQAPPPGIASACSEIGVLGVVPGVIGSLQAAEALKFILSIGRPLTGRIMRFDALSSSFREYKTMRDPNCSLCGETPTIISFETKNDRSFVSDGATV
jgi:adenylyltransferase/sulfurtransferase